jgi:hypothetical protein
MLGVTSALIEHYKNAQDDKRVNATGVQLQATPLRGLY